MGTLSASLSLNSPDVLSSVVNVSVGVAVNADSGNFTRVKVAATGLTGAVTVYKANDKLESAYLYVKNMHQEREKFAYVFADTNADDPVFLKLAGNEFAFMPVKNDVTLKAYVTEVDQIIEYGVFGLDSSSVTLS
jgi:hypothetical protein